MPPDIDVHAEELHRCASVLADTAAGLHPAVHGRSALVPPVSGWVVTEAAGTLRAAADRHWADLAEAVATIGRHLATAAADYDGADRRAAGRLRGTGRTP